MAGFKMALASSFRTDFRESLSRMIGALTRTGVTNVSTVKVVETFTELALSPYSISFLSDDIIRLRYVEIDGQLRKVLIVVKMRAGDHSKDICDHEITQEGLRIGGRLKVYQGLIMGIPEPLVPGERNGGGTGGAPKQKEWEWTMGAKLGIHADDDAPEIGKLSQYFSERSPQPMVAVDGTTHIVSYLNPAFARLVGKDRNDLMGRPFAEAVPEGAANGCLALLDRVYQTGLHENLPEQEHRQIQPFPVYWSYSVWAIVSEDNHSSGVMIQVTDSTETAVFRRQVMKMNECFWFPGQDSTSSLPRRNRSACDCRVPYIRATAFSPS